MQKLEKIQQMVLKMEVMPLRTEKSIEEGPGNKKEDSQDGNESGNDKRDNEMTK